MSRNRKHFKQSDWDASLDADEYATQRTIHKALVYAVYRYSLEPSERISIDHALRILDKYHRRKHAECMLYLLEDQMVFRKIRRDGNNPFRTRVTYKELMGFRRDLKHKHHFVMLINSEMSHVRYYEVYKCKYKEDVDMIERCIFKAMEDPDSILRSNDQSYMIQAPSETTAELPTQISRQIQTSNNGDTTFYTNTFRRSKSTSPTNASNGYKVNEYTSPFMSSSRKAVNAAPYSQPPIKTKARTATHERVVPPLSTLPRTRSTSPTYLAYSSSVLNESLPIRNERVLSVASRPPGGQSSSLVYTSGYQRCANKTKTISVLPKPARPQSSAFAYSSDHRSDVVERPTTVPTESFTPVQREPNSFIYSGGYPRDKKRTPKSEPVRYISVPCYSVQREPNSKVYPRVKSPIMSQQSKSLESAPVNELTFSLMSPRGYPDRVDAAQSSLYHSKKSTNHQEQSPQRGYPRDYPYIRFGLQNNDRTHETSIPDTPMRQTAPSTVYFSTSSGNMYELEKPMQIPSKTDPENFITLINKTVDSGYGDVTSLSSDVVDDIVTAIPASLRSTPDNFPDRFSVHRISPQDNLLSQSAKLLSVSLPAINSTSLASPAKLRREAVLSMADLTYLNYENTGLMVSEQNGPIYLYAARQPAIRSKQSVSSWDKQDSNQYFSNNIFKNKY
ncbi:hypothetical protein D915_001585 [Fasciola hepatica]|uniref:Trematode PH-like domain-containing protein n=1 Tax=Fasciola hepatica TaxID=6192 RepID=A0A4E0RX13_FASHE|nr:hypothetical protein D915_001585 [Fasciola hepatica]